MESEERESFIGICSGLDECDCVRLANMWHRTISEKTKVVATTTIIVSFLQFMGIQVIIAAYQK